MNFARYFDLLASPLSVDSCAISKLAAPLHTEWLSKAVTALPHISNSSELIFPIRIAQYLNLTISNLLG